MHFKFKWLFFVAIILAAQLSYAGCGLNILLVDDDNYSSPDHIARIEQAITDAGYSYVLFNAQDSAASPTASVMSQYDLVFWYTANDGVGSYFWNGSDTLNTELKDYLDSGGMVWAMGNDIIYDMYGGAPDTFSTGDFLYDYFGIAQYDVQSKVNDGGTGVPQLDRVDGQNVATTLATIHWYVSGVWYADGCTPAAGAVRVYNFGDASYTLAGYATAIFYDNGTSKTFGSYFDAYYMDTDANRAAFFGDVLDYFNSFLAAGDPPSACSLTSPVDSAQIQILSGDGSTLFDWSDSVDPDGGAVSYRWYLAGTKDISESSLLEKNSNESQLAVSNMDLINLFTSGDTLNLWWSVRAKDECAMETWAADTFRITLIRYVNLAPEAFALQYPQDEKHLFFSSGDSTHYSFSWDAANDVDEVTYTLRVSELNGTKVFQTDLSGTSYTVDIHDYLDAAGQDTVKLQWDVRASDGEFNVLSENGPFVFSCVKQKQSLMFVGDDNYSSHVQDVLQTLDNIGAKYDFFDCGNDGSDGPAQMPTFDELKAYDMVFWFTGNDGKLTAFWSGQDTTNNEIVQYLDNGGKLWVSGNDFVYDRYGGAPDSFANGDFLRDYLGIASYDAQSKVDDSGGGLPLIYLDSSADSLGISSQDTLYWRYSGLWYADAVTPVEEAQTIFRMGPDDYALAGSPAAVYYNPGAFAALSMYFNVRQFNTANHNEMGETLFFEVINWLQNEKIITAIGANDGLTPSSFTVGQNYPNPFNPTTTINFNLPAKGQVTVSVFNILGKKIFEHEGVFKTGWNHLTLNGAGWASGLYFYRVTFNGQAQVHKMMLLK